MVNENEWVKLSNKPNVGPEHEFCDKCPGCRPALADMETGKPLPQDDPLMIKINDVWDHKTTLAQRYAYVEVTLGRTQNKILLERANEVVNLFKELL